MFDFIFKRVRNNIIEAITSKAPSILIIKDAVHLSLKN